MAKRVNDEDLAAYRHTMSDRNSSPSSLSGPSNKDTPITKFSNISPDAPHLMQRPSYPRVLRNDIPTFFTVLAREDPLHSEGLVAYKLSEADPFTASTDEVCGGTISHKLSATADVFKPNAAVLNLSHYPSIDLREHLRLIGWPSLPILYLLMTALFSKMRYSSHSDSAKIPREEALYSIVNKQYPSCDHNVQLNTGASIFPNIQQNVRSTHFKFGDAIKLKNMPTESRYLMVSGLPFEHGRVYLDALLATPVVAHSRIAVSDHMMSSGMILLRYDDLRCAKHALEKIQSEFPEWGCQFVRSGYWSVMTKGYSYPPPSDFEGQILVTLMLNAPKVQLDTSSDHIETHYPELSSFMARVGDVQSSRRIAADENTLAVHFKFFSLHAAEAAIAQASRQPLNDVRLCAVNYVDSNKQMRSTNAASTKKSLRLLDQSPILQPTSLQDKERQESYKHQTSIELFHSSLAKLPDTSRRWSHSSQRSLNSPASNHNVVDVDRIREGHDVRTTIMLRNIPNKVDQPMLKEIVDETSFGKYDFMYLRIDFANNCNVGYAFINFEDSQSIIDFVETIAGKKWNRFNSDKIAEVSYATIQGRDCLVQKFRNSSVMLEAPLFRPKIFYTGAGPSAGKEEEFPSPDNHSKMRRSLENAEHVGLFAPRIGQCFRDEQRRRRSRYDRGTRLAEIDEQYDTSVVKASKTLTPEIEPFQRPRSLIHLSPYHSSHKCCQ